MHKILIFLCAVTYVILSGCTTIGESEATGYQVETLVSGGPMHGAKGITFGPDGHLYVCSVYAQRIYRVDISTGAVEIAVDAPYGESDDVAFSPTGTMVWSALPSAELRARDPNGEPFVLANKLPLINPLGYTRDGRLFAAQIGIDRFLEVDVKGDASPRLVMKGIGHLNSFEIDDNDQLYGPLAGVGTLARIDLNEEQLTPIAENLDTLAAVNLDSRGQIYAVGWNSGELLRFDPTDGTKTLITTLDPPLDNLAIDDNDMIYVSLPARGAIVRVDPATGTETEIVPGNMGVPGGLSISEHNGRETIFVADDFGFRLVDTESGDIWATTDLAEFMDPNAASDIATNDDVIVLSDVSRSRVYMLDRKTGEKIQKWRGIGTPYGVALLDSGNPVFAEFDKGQLILLDKTDRKLRTVLAKGLAGPVGLVKTGPGSLLVTEAIAGRVSQIDLTNGSRTIIAEGLIQPEGLTLMSDGRIAVVEAGAARVSAIDPTTGAISILATNLPIGASLPKAPGPIYVPSGIAAGKNGVLYLSSDQQQSLLKIVPAE